MITGLYRGNSDPGQLIDSSGQGNHLTLNGTVPSPSSPTPPEGDQWLAYQPVGAGANYLQGPNATFNNAQGMVAFMLVKDFPVITTTLFFRFLNGLVSGHQIGFFTDGTLFFSGFENGLGINLFTTPFPADSVVHKVRYEWDLTGTRGYLDDVLVGSSAVPISALGALLYLGGDPQSTANGLDTGGMDFIMTSNDPNEIYPPVSIVTQSIAPILGGACGPANPIEKHARREAQRGIMPMRLDRKRKIW